jgi:type I restriction enzyme S subunit
MIATVRAGMGVPHLFQADIKKFPLPSPALEHQRAIADYLDAETGRIDALIARKRRLAELLDERFASYRAHALLRDFDPISGNGDLPAGWRSAALGVCIQLQRGHDLPEQDREPGEVPIISSGGVSGWHAHAAVQGPGVVTGRYGTVGDAYYVEGPYWPLNTTLYVKDFRTNHPRWVFHLLAALPLDSDSAKSAVTGINRNVVGTLRVPRPPLAAQERLAALIDAARASIDRASTPLRRQIDLLYERRQSLITAAVTGALAVPGVAA